MKGDRVSNLRWRLGLKHCITVDSVRSGGGLALFWHESVDVTLIEKHQSKIYRCPCEGESVSRKDSYHFCVHSHS